MQKFWLVMGAVAAMTSPLVSAQAATSGLVSSSKVSPVGVVSLQQAAAKVAAQPLVPMAARVSAPVYHNERFTFGRPFSDVAPMQVNDRAFPIPAASPAKVNRADKSVFGFDGLSEYDQAAAGTGVYARSQLGTEPPDQALAVGHGYVVEAVNNAIAVYKTNGKLIAAPMPMNQFLGLEPEFLPAQGIDGSVSLSDVRAYYDAPSGRFFIEEWGTGQDAAGNATGISAIYLAVSQTSDPTGNYSLYQFDTTFDPNDPLGANDPILPDFVQIGADANGFYMSFNQFAYFMPNAPFIGPRILAVSKADLIAGASTPLVSFSGGDLFNSNAGFTVYPARTPAGGRFEAAHGGTEYFLSTVFDTSANQLGLWAITNTASLDTNSPNLSLTDTLINSHSFTQPTAAIQKAGPYPQGTADGDLEALLDSGDTRMTQVTYVLGHLYSAVETSFPDASGNIPQGTDSGFTYFSVAPHVDAGGNVSGVVDHQGYARLPGETLAYPSFGVSSTGGAVITCALIGPDFFPSAAYIPLDSHLKASTVQISSLGVAPDDGFTGYGSTDASGNPIQGIARWGDYSQVQADENGNIWAAQETISDKSNNLRNDYANFGTFITKVKPTGSFGYGGQ